MGALVLLACFCLTPKLAYADGGPAAQISGIALTFPGTVLSAPDGLQPFAGLPLTSATSDPGSYEINWRDPLSTSGYARISGSFTSPVNESFAQCSSTALYCSEHVLHREDGPLGSEIFRGLSVNGNAAVVTHVACCTGVYWDVFWSDPAQGLNYDMEFSLAVAQVYGDAIQGDRREAAALISIASQLVPVTPSTVSPPRVSVKQVALGIIQCMGPDSYGGPPYQVMGDDVSASLYFPNNLLTTDALAYSLERVNAQGLVDREQDDFLPDDPIQPPLHIIRRAGYAQIDYRVQDIVDSCFEQIYRSALAGS